MQPVSEISGHTSAPLTKHLIEVARKPRSQQCQVGIYLMVQPIKEDVQEERMSAGCIPSAVQRSAPFLLRGVPASPAMQIHTQSDQEL